MDEEKRQKITLWCVIIGVILTAMALLVLIFRPQIWKSLEKDDLAVFMICENWSVPSCVGNEVERLSRIQSTDANQVNIEKVLKVKSLDRLLIYNKGEGEIPELCIYILDSEYAEIVKKGKIVKEIKGEILREPLGRLLIGEDIIVRVWRCCLAEKEDSERGVTILRGGWKGQRPKISFLTPTVVDFDDWVKKLVESKNNSLFIYSLPSVFAFMVLLLTVLLWKCRRKRRTTIAK